jgi:hypothetical protein
MVDARANTEGIKGRLRDALSEGVTELLDCEIPQSTSSARAMESPTLVSARLRMSKR